MRRLADLRAAAAALALAATVATVPVSLAAASPVDDQERKVDQIADRLDRIDEQYTELTEELASAEAAKTELDAQIAEASAKVAVLEEQIGHLEGQLSELAINAFVNSGAMTASPLFSDASRLSDGLARDHLTRVAMDLGDADVDEYDSILLDLEKQRADLRDKQERATAYAEQIADDQAEAERLHTEYETAYAKAQTELGQLLEEEEQRRAEAAYAKMLAEQEAQRAAQRPPVSTSGPGRGGGASGGGSTSGSSTTSTSTSAASSAGSSASAAPDRDRDDAQQTSSSASANVPPVSGNAGVAINAAMGQLGVPYRYAASQPGVAFDCSGLTAYAWGRAGVSLPHQSGQQYASTPHVPKDQAQPGDLIFYYSPIGHVAIYLGGGQMIHAPRSGDVVKVAAVNWGKVVGVSRPG